MSKGLPGTVYSTTAIRGVAVDPAEPIICMWHPKAAASGLTQKHESGQNKVFVRPYPQLSKGKWQISTHGAGAPLWSPDGRALFFRSNEPRIDRDFDGSGVQSRPTNVTV